MLPVLFLFLEFLLVNIELIVHATARACSIPGGELSMSVKFFLRTWFKKIIANRLSMIRIRPTELTCTQASGCGNGRLSPTSRSTFLSHWSYLPEPISIFSYHSLRLLFVALQGQWSSGSIWRFVKHKTESRKIGWLRPQRVNIPCYLFTAMKVAILLVIKTYATEELRCSHVLTLGWLWHEPEAVRYIVLVLLRNGVYLALNFLFKDFIVFIGLELMRICWHLLSLHID